MSFTKQFTSIQARKKDIQDRPDIAGYVRVGEPTSTGKGKVNGYFRLADTAEEFIEHFEFKYGKEPVMIPIYFPTNDKDITRIWQYEWWKDKRMWGYGDGINFMVWNPARKGYEPCTPADDLFQTLEYKYWSEQMTLRFKIPGFPAEGFFVLKTGGADTSIPNIKKSMDYVELCFNGELDHMLFYLMVEMGKSKMPGNTRKFPVIKLRSAYTIEQIHKLQHAFTSGDLKREEITSYLQIQKYLEESEELKPTKIIKEKAPKKIKKAKEPEGIGQGETGTTVTIFQNETKSEENELDPT